MQFSNFSNLSARPVCILTRLWPHHTMSDSESSVGGPAHSRAGPVKTRAKRKAFFQICHQDLFASSPAGPAKTRGKRKAGHVDSTSDDLQDDDATFSDDGPHERERPKLSWTPITTTLTWADADVFLRDLTCKECNGYALCERHGSRHTATCTHSPSVMATQRLPIG